MSSKRAKGSVGGGEAGKKAKTTPDAGEKSVSEKSQVTRTCRNPFEKSKSKQTEFFVREVKDKRMTKNGPEFLMAKCHVRVSKQSCKQANRLILWGFRSTTKKKSRFFFIFSS